MNCERCNIVQNAVDGFSFVTIDEVKLRFTKCMRCSQCVGIEKPDGWKPVKHFLRRNQLINGIHPVVSLDDKIVHYILRQFLYNETESHENKDGIQFDDPDKSDIIMLMWSEGYIMGFFTLKPKGTWVENVNDIYAFTTLDTIFVHKDFRGFGCSQKMLEYICTTNNGQDIGISKPISPPMKSALYKFLIVNPQFRNQLWEIEGTGGEGERKLIWFMLKAESKSKHS